MILTGTTILKNGRFSKSSVSIPTKRGFDRREWLVLLAQGFVTARAVCAERRPYGSKGRGWLRGHPLTRLPLRGIRLGCLGGVWRRAGRSHTGGSQFGLVGRGC